MRSELANRVDAVHSAKSAERDAKRKEKDAYLSGETTASGASRDLELMRLYEEYGPSFEAEACTKRLEQWVQVPTTETMLFSTASPDVIEARFLSYLNKQKLLTKPSGEKYKLRFVQTGAYEGGEQYEVAMIMRVYQHGTKQVVVEFQKQAGDQLRFLHHFHEYVRGPLQPFDDSDVSTFADNKV